MSRGGLGALTIVDVLVRSGAAKSKGDARSIVNQGGAYLNNRRIEDIDHKLTTAELLHDRYVVLRKGRRDYRILRFG